MSKQPFIEFNAVGGDVIFANKCHIVDIYRGGGRCYVKLAFIEAPIQARESYEQLKTMLRD